MKLTQINNCFSVRSNIEYGFQLSFFRFNFEFTTFNNDL